jgi:hypothetical protein
VQISTNLKSELWFFHSGLGIFSGPKSVVVVVVGGGGGGGGGWRS